MKAFVSTIDIRPQHGQVGTLSKRRSATCSSFASYGDRSPEAKGRVERANGTFQGRLVAELRLAGACTLADANQVLTEFLPRFNQRFGVPADQPESVYRPVDPELDLGSVLCTKELRRVAKDNTVQYHGRALQLYPSTERPSYAGARVEVQERLDGCLLLRHRIRF